MVGGGGGGAFALSGAFVFSCAIALPASDAESQRSAILRFISGILSEPEFQRKLNHTGIYRRRQNAPETRRRERCRRISKLRMIQRVEEFGAKFQARAIRPRRDGKLLEEREIQVGLVCPTHDPDSGIPERRCPVVVADDRELRRNTALVEVIVEAALERSAGHQLWVSAAGNELCPIAADAENVCGIRLCNRDPPARLNCSHK